MRRGATSREGPKSGNGQANWMFLSLKFYIRVVPGFRFDMNRPMKFMSESGKFGKCLRHFVPPKAHRRPGSAIRPKRSPRFTEMSTNSEDW